MPFRAVVQSMKPGHLFSRWGQLGCSISGCELGRSVATLRQRVSVTSKAHYLKQVSNPWERVAIRTVLDRGPRAAGRSQPRRAPAQRAEPEMIARLVRRARGGRQARSVRAFRELAVRDATTSASNGIHLADARPSPRP